MRYPILELMKKIRNYERSINLIIIFAIASVCWGVLPEAIKRESGENPEQTRYCEFY